MAPPQLETSKLFARDIATYSDAKLDRYLEANGRFVEVKDPENLPEDFIQRLRARASASHTALSRPIDLNYVSTRLEEVPGDNDPLPQRYPSVSSTASIDEEEDYRLNLERETESYHKLINAGGRPSHPISLDLDVAKDLEQYREILSFWIGSPPSRIVFYDQLGSWEEFRELQQRIRTNSSLKVRSVFPALPAKPGRFAAYCQRLYKRLAKHGFERSFQLNEDLDRQNKLTTWIEYLGCRYVQYDNYANIMKRLQQQYDEAWKKLVDSNVLKPLETEESFKYFFFLQLKQEETDAEKAVEFARSTVKSAEEELLEARSAGLSERNLSRIEQKFSTARSKLAAATESFGQSSRRRKLIKEFNQRTMEYSRAKDEADHQIKLLRWILQQVPLIELELNPRKEIDASTEGDGRQRRNLKRNRADDHSEKPISKRLRQHDENHTPSKSKTSASTTRGTTSTHQPRQTRSSHTNPSTLPSKPRSQRVLPASRPSTTKPNSAKCGVVVDNSARVRKGRQRKRSSLYGTPDSQVLRRSCRPKRLPERFQWGSNEPS